MDLSRRTTTGDPEGETLEAHEVPAAESLEAALADLRGEIELSIPTASAVKIGGERAYKLHRQGVVVEMPLRRSQVDALDVIAYTAGIATLDLRVSSGTYVRSIADALGGHCVSLRRTEVGPFSVEEADAERVLSLDEALGRIGMTVAEAEAERQRKAQSDREAHEERKAREAALEEREEAHGAGIDAGETGAEAGTAASPGQAAEERGVVGG